MRLCIPEPNSGCWLWIGATLANGYAGMRGHGGGKAKMERASRLMWLEVKKTALGKLCVLHRCDNPGCVNPDHLFLGTRSDNVKDMVDKGRHRGGCLIGELNPRCMVSEQIAKAIISAYENGMSASAAGALFGVNASRAQGIAYGKSWKYLPRTGNRRSVK